MKKVSYRSKKVGESEHATNILSKLKAYLSLQSLLNDHKMRMIFNNCGILCHLCRESN